MSAAAGRRRHPGGGRRGCGGPAPAPNRGSLRAVTRRCARAGCSTATPLPPHPPHPPCSATIAAFLDSPGQQALTFNGDALAVSAGLPKRAAASGKGGGSSAGAGGRAVYVLKKPAVGRVSDAAPGDDLLVCDLAAPGGEPLAHLARLLRDVYVPLLAHHRAGGGGGGAPGGLGDAAAREVADRLHGLLARTAIAACSARGEVVLPLPPLDAATLAGLGRHERTRLLEGALAVWSRQAGGVLRADPEDALRGGRHPGPDAELAFWRGRAGALGSLVAQLRGDPVRRVLTVLDAVGSPTCTPFARLCRDMLDGRAEADDNVRFLAPLEREWVPLG